MLKIAVIGVGHQGRNHLRVLSALEGIKLSLLVDLDVAKAKSAAAELKVPASDSYRNHLSGFDAALIAVPTTDHASIAKELMLAGKHVLIEKPVAATIEEAEELQQVASKTGIVAHVGFPERYNPMLQKALPEITRPLFIEAHRLGEFSPRSLDVDVVLDLMIHDLDLLFLLLKEEPLQIEAVGIPVLSANIDIANARLKFPGGCVVNLTGSRVSAQRMRKMRLFQPYSYLSLDFAQQSYSRFTVRPNMCNAGLPEIDRSEFQMDPPHQPLVGEWIAFRNAITQGDSAGVSIAESIASLKMALAIKQGFTAPEL
jgi:predicted dehydrogenase